jgi:hypothetical protein
VDAGRQRPASGQALSHFSPPVSIVVATHNRRDWLRLAMDSVLDQDYGDLELLVMDDGSTDDTPGLLRDYAHRHAPERFRFLRHENMGQARTLNRGYELARGEVLGYLSDDDLLAPGAITRLVEALADPEVIGAYPCFRIIDVNGAVMDTVRPTEYSPLDAFRMIDTVIGPGCLVRRWALEASGGWDPDLRFVPDFLLWLNLGMVGRLVRVEEPLAAWRRHAGSVSVRADAGRGEEILGFVDRGAAVLDLPPDAVEDRAEALRNASLHAAFLGGAPGASPGERFATIDLTRALTSAASAGLQPTEMPDERSDRAAELWRKLALLTLQLVESRSGDASTGHIPRDAPRGAGLDAARRRLRRIGVLGEKAGDSDGWGHPDVRLELMEAALECGADADPRTSRYLVLDRRDGLSEEELDELNQLGFGASADQLDAVIANRRRRLQVAGERPSGVDR